MRLTQIQKIEGQIELISGLHIGGSSAEMHIGGTDNPVIKNPVNNQPYIPGSSIKGKLRSLLEWQFGLVALTQGKPLGFRQVLALQGEQQQQAKAVLKLFGGAPEGEPDKEMAALIAEIGPTRLAFWDCSLDPTWVAQMQDRLLTEIKTENTIDRIAGTAQHPRNTERVPAGARFLFQLTLKVHDDEDLLDTVLLGFKLLELTGLGGSGSRGYGKLRFTDLRMGEQDLQARLPQIAV